MGMTSLKAIDAAMNTLYESETFCLVHMIAPSADPADADAATLPLRQGFELVDKRSGKEVYLDGSWAELFSQRLAAWQAQQPTEEEVEETLDCYAALAQTPVLLH